MVSWPQTCLLIIRPCLLECSDYGYALYSDELDFPELDERDKVTIQQDVRRSFTRFPGNVFSCSRVLIVDLDDVRRAELESKLNHTIYRVLRIHPRLHYVQVSPNQALLMRDITTLQKC